MKLVFTLDIKLSIIDGAYYTVGGVADYITERYTNYADSMTIICRVIEKLPADSNLIKIKNPRVRIISASNGSLLISKSAKKTIEETVLLSDGLVAKLPSRISEVAIRAAKKHDIPYIVECVGCPWDSFWNYSLLGKIVAPIMFLSTRMAIRHAPFAIYVTEHFLQSRYPCSRATLACSDVQLQAMDENVLNTRIAKIQNASPPYILGTLAGLNVPWKRQKDVIKALAILKKRGIVFYYRLAGGGNFDYLKGVATKCGVQDQVFFSGNLPHEEIFPWLDNIDIYIQPSKQEGLPRALIEAISRACPALGSTAGGIGELLEPKYIFPKGNVKAICNLLIAFTKEDMLYAAEENYQTAKKYEKIYLDNKRNKFYKEFVEACSKKRNK